jgi:hypothetical protein
MLRIRNGFNADPDPDPAFISMLIQRAKPMRIHAGPDPGQSLSLQKI